MVKGLKNNREQQLGNVSMINREKFPSRSNKHDKKYQDLVK